MTDSDAFAPGAAGPDDAYQARRQRGGARPIAALLSDLAEEIRSLFRLELALFKAELAEKLSRLGRGLGALAIGAVLAFSGWVVLLAAAVLALAIVVRPWLAALIVGVAAIVVGLLFLYLAKRWLDAHSLVPRRSLDSLRQDEAWIGERLP